MDWVIIVGCLALGALIGGLVCHFVVGVREFGLRELSGAVSILSGAGVIAIFHFIGGGGNFREYWFYPVGLLLGFIVISSNYVQEKKRRAASAAGAALVQGHQNLDRPNAVPARENP
jgi:peptidoglycan/LPS O-acetylase OafA/YrhL